MPEIQLTEIIRAYYSCLKSFQLYAEVEDDFKGQCLLETFCAIIITIIISSLLKRITTSFSFILKLPL